MYFEFHRVAENVRGFIAFIAVCKTDDINELFLQ